MLWGQQTRRCQQVHRTSLTEGHTNADGKPRVNEPTHTLLHDTAQGNPEATPERGTHEDQLRPAQGHQEPAFTGGSHSERSGERDAAGPQDTESENVVNSGRDKWTRHTQRGTLNPLRTLSGSELKCHPREDARVLAGHLQSHL